MYQKLKSVSADNFKIFRPKLMFEQVGDLNNFKQI